MIRGKIIFPIAAALYVAAYFTATQPITPRLALVSSLSVIIFAMPSYLAAMKCLGKKKGLLLLGALGIYALIIESLAIHTGFPYGNFTYTDILGNKLFGLTPWTVAFAYPPILLLAYYTAHTFGRSQTSRVLAGTAFLATLVDMVLDPAAVRLRFWYWENPGFFYGVPLINFLGWLLTAFVGALILHLCVRNVLAHKVPVGFAYSGLAILWFWTAVNLWLQQWIPALLGIGLGIFLVRLVTSKQDTINK